MKTHFVQTVGRWAQTVDIPASKTTVHNNSDSSKVIEDGRSIENLSKDMEQFAKVEERILFLCKNGEDSVSCELLAQLLENSPVNITKITDKTESGTCSILHLLAQQNKYRCLELVAERFSNIDVLDSIMATPLLHAVGHNCQESAAFLLSRNANVNAKDTYSKYPLLVSLKSKNYQTAELLASFNTLDVHLRGTKGNTVLHIMAETGDLRAVQFLVSKLKASPQRRNGDEENVLFFCLKHLEICSYLGSAFSKDIFKMISSTNTDGRNVFHMAAIEGTLDGLLVLLRNADLSNTTYDQVVNCLNAVDRSGDTPIILAVKHSRKEMVNFLCECEEVNINDGDKDGNTPLYHAIESKNVKIATVLTNARASLRASNVTLSDQSRDDLFSRCFSLNSLLVFMISVVAVLCIITIAAISIGFFASNIADNTAKIRERSFGEVLDYLFSSVEEHATIGVTAGYQMYNSEFDIRDADDVMQLAYNTFLANYKRARIMSSSYLGLLDGSIGGIVKGNTENEAQYFEAYQSPYYIHWYQVSDVARTKWTSIRSLPADEFNVTQLDIDNYHMLWDVVKANTTIWTDSYAVGGSFAGWLFISFMVPLHDQAGQFIGYYGLDATTESLNPFLQQKAREDSSVIAIVERKTGYLIATSDPTVELYKQEGFNVIRYDGSTAKNKRIAGMLNYARKQYGGHLFAKVRGTTYDSFWHQGKKHALNIGVIQDEFRLDWVITQSLPMDSFYRTFYISLGIMASVTVLLLIISVVIAVIAAKIFMKPIQTIIEQAEDIKMLQLEKVEQSLAHKFSYFSEVKTLQASFESMTARLKQFREFIPDHILSIIEAEVSAGVVAMKQSSTVDKGMSPTDDTSSTRLSNVSSRNGANGIVNKALKSALTSSEVTVMAVRFSNLTSMLEQYSAGDVSETTKQLLGGMKDCIRESNGQLVSISSSKAIIVWNSFIPQSDHRLRGCRTAVNCVGVLKKLQVEWEEKQLPVLQVFIGISSGPVVYGNIGSDLTKFFTVLGPAADEANRLSHISMQQGIPVVITEALYEATRDDFVSRAIETDLHGHSLYELGEGKNDEWLNEMNQQSDKWTTFRLAYNLIQREKYEEAVTHLEDHLATDKDDAVAKRYLLLCQQQSTHEL